MTIEEALLRVGDELKKVMTQELKDNGSYNTGKLAASIQYSVEQKQWEYNLVRTMLTYGVYVDQGNGRHPGKQPPVKDLIEWIKFKKIPVPQGLTIESFAFAIARKIGKQGTNPRPRPFITPSINKVMKTTGKELLSKAGVDEVTINIGNKLQNIKVKA